MKFKKTLRAVPDFVFILLGSALLVRLFKFSVPAASDFEVYWRAIHAWVEGKSPYAHYTQSYVGLVFKYPPWILPMFLPFAFLDLESSKWVWTIAQVLAIFYSMFWLVRHGVQQRVVSLISLMFWYMWFAHTYFGQITVFMLALGLWTLKPLAKGGQENFSPGRLSFFIYVLTSKVFSMISLIGCWKEVIRPKTLALGFSWLVLTHILLFVSFPYSMISNAPHVIVQLYSDWILAASSGGAELGALIVRGQQNHGFAAAILRALEVDATKVGYDIALCSFIALILSILWAWYSRSLKTEERWAGWLAMGVIAHPLAWHHSFVMAYPLCVFALQRAVSSRDRVLIFFALFGTSCIGIFVPQVIGTGAVRPLELFANKSWGVVISGIVVLVASKKLSKTYVHRH
jgi:hypothetical protein